MYQSYSNKLVNWLRLASYRAFLIHDPVPKLNFPLSFTGRANNGSIPSHWCAGSGSIARKSLQTLEQLKMVEKDPNGGRRLTSQGRRDLDRIAAQVATAHLPPKK